MSRFFEAPGIKPLSAEYHNSVYPADPKIAPTQSITKLFVSESGVTRMDFGDTSVINDAAGKKTVFLDHLKKIAQVVPMGPPEPPKVEVPKFGAPAAPPPLPAAPAPVSVKDLGTRFLDGHEVQGKQYVFPPPPLPEPVKLPEMAKAPEPPKLPEAPKLPAPPKAPELAKLPKGLEAPKAQDLKAKMPGAKLEAPKTPELPKKPDLPKVPEPPKAPQAAEAPNLPPPPPLPLKETTSEVWSSTSLLIPMLSRTISSWGKQVSHCKRAVPGEPNPALFQIPPEYKQVEGFQTGPEPPKAPPPTGA